MTEQESWLDGMLRTVGGVIRQAIMDAHPERPRHGKRSCGDQHQAESYVRDAFKRDRRHMRYVEHYWSLPYNEARRMLEKS